MSSASSSVKDFVKKRKRKRERESIQRLTSGSSDRVGNAVVKSMDRFAQSERQQPKQQQPPHDQEEQVNENEGNHPDKQDHVLTKEVVCPPAPRKNIQNVNDDDDGKPAAVMLLSSSSTSSSTRHKKAKKDKKMLSIHRREGKAAVARMVQDLRQELHSTREELQSSRRQCQRYKEKYWDVVHKCRRWWTELQEWIPQQRRQHGRMLLDPSHNGIPQIEGLMPLVTPSTHNKTKKRKKGLQQRPSTPDPFHPPHEDAYDSSKENDQEENANDDSNKENENPHHDASPHRLKKIASHPDNKQTKKQQQQRRRRLPLQPLNDVFCRPTQEPRHKDHDDDDKVDDDEDDCHEDKPASQTNSMATASDTSPTQGEHSKDTDPSIPVISARTTTTLLQNKTAPTTAPLCQNTAMTKPERKPSPHKSSPDGSQPLLDSVQAGGWTSNKSSRRFMHQDYPIPKTSPTTTLSIRHCPPQVLATAQANDSSPADKHKKNNNKPSFKYQQVVRGKAQRQALKGWSCPECDQFWNAVCHQQGNATVFQRQHFENCSRHRAAHSPSHTPQDFWELSFLDERRARQEQEKQQEQEQLD